MNYLRNVALNDFVSQKNDAGEIEVLVKKLYEPSDPTDRYSEKVEYICIRKDFFMEINDMFNAREEKAERLEKQLCQIRKILQEGQ